MTTHVKTRFAPSPSGFLHVGNARIALFCALLARHRRGIFLLRIEDTDRERCETHYIEAVEEDLRWLGLNWQEGPNAGGVGGPYMQSGRTAIYQEYFERLETAALVYPCFCSAQELALSRKTQISAGKPPRYAGTCAALAPEQIRERLAKGELPTLRFRVPRGAQVEFEDLVRGPQCFATDDIGDFIIRRADGTSAFFFSNAVDDALMQVTHVLRGEDHLTNTPRQILLLRALGLEAPAYGHLSLIVGADGAPLSKRHGSSSVRELRDEGYFAAAVTNYLARLGHHYTIDSLLALDALAAEFQVEKLGRAPVHFDSVQLRHWQQQAIAHASTDELWRWMGEDVHAQVPESQVRDFIETVRPNVELPPHALLWARILYHDPLVLSPAASAVIVQTGQAFFEHTLQALVQQPEDFKAFTKILKGAVTVSGKALYQPLRAALTGELDGPEMARLLPLLGAERAHSRLQSAVQHCIKG